MSPQSCTCCFWGTQLLFGTPPAPPGGRALPLALPFPWAGSWECLLSSQPTPSSTALPAGAGPHLQRQPQRALGGGGVQGCAQLGQTRRGQQETARTQGERAGEGLRGGWFCVSVEMQMRHCQICFPGQTDTAFKANVEGGLFSLDFVLALCSLNQPILSNSGNSSSLFKNFINHMEVHLVFQLLHPSSSKRPDEIH